MEWTLQWIAKSLPQPEGPYQVGYHDIMTPGLPEDSTLMRILYPAALNTPRPVIPPLWTDATPKAGCIEIIKSMVFNWPSWAPNSEYRLFPVVRALLSKITFPLVFSAGWTLLGERLTLPTIPNALLHPPPSPQGWPVVMFSHGMGCTRASMSQLTYQLASQGVVVVSLEHREGSASSSFYRVARGARVEHIPHRCLDGDEDELTEREAQARHRGREVIRALGLLERIQAGECIDNLLAPGSPCLPSPLAGTLDLASLFLMGHSFGGATVLLADSLLRAEREGAMVAPGGAEILPVNDGRNTAPRLAGTLALDPWMFPVHKMQLRVESPLLVINSEAFLIAPNVEAVHEAVKDCRQDVEWEVLEGGVHLSATDIPMLFPQVYLRKGLGFMATAKPEDAMKKLNGSVWDFISRRLAKEDGKASINRP